MRRSLERLWIVLGAAQGLAAVAMAALAAHGLGWLDPGQRAMLDRALEIQGWHAPVLVLCGVWAGRGGGLAHVAGAAFAAGAVLFCGAVYALALGGVSLGPTAPTGGILLMLGWLLLGASAWRAR
jgi:uncharacterized membrane protein YgdD (TMEM256/DUF423 family)